MSSHEELICTEPIYENDPWEWQNVCDNTLTLAYCKGVSVKKSEISCWLVSPAWMALKFFWTY